MKFNVRPHVRSVFINVLHIDVANDLSLQVEMSKVHASWGNQTDVMMPEVAA